MNFEVSPSGYGIHWPELDEDLSIDGMIKTQRFERPDKSHSGTTDKI
jgi:hypothetical protein